MTDPSPRGGARDPRIQALIQADADRRARLAAMPDVLRPGDAVVVPMPVLAPEQWVVAAVSGAHAELVAADDRPFFAPTDPWFEAPAGEMCLRPAARVGVPVAQLRAQRVDHWSAATEALAVAPAGDRDDVLAVEELVFRAQLQRAVRLLPDWLAARTLRLTLPDFGIDDASATRADDQQKILRANARLAAATDGPRSRLRRLDALVEVAARSIELLTDRGKVVLRVHPRAISFAFVPTESSVTPPPIACMLASGGSQPLPWVWQADAGEFLARVPHDLLTHAFAAEIGADRAFRAIVAAAPHWS
jgi:hypothetical protein